MADVIDAAAERKLIGVEVAHDLCHKRHRSVADLTVSLAVAKIGGFRTVLGCHLTQASLESFNFPTAFQAENESSIPFTRSNLFNDLVGGPSGIVSSRTAILCHGAAITPKYSG
jgi:hypothetical protein